MLTQASPAELARVATIVEAPVDDIATMFCGWPAARPPGSDAQLLTRRRRRWCTALGGALEQHLAGLQCRQVRPEIYSKAGPQIKYESQTGLRFS